MSDNIFPLTFHSPLLALPNRHVGHLFIRICVLFVLDPACFSNEPRFKRKLPAHKLTLCNCTTRLHAKKSHNLSVPLRHSAAVTRRVFFFWFYFRVAVCQVTELKPDYVTSTGDVYGSLRDAEQVLTQRNITDIACSDAVCD